MSQENAETYNLGLTRLAAETSNGFSKRTAA